VPANKAKHKGGGQAPDTGQWTLDPDEDEDEDVDLVAWHGMSVTQFFRRSGGFKTLRIAPRNPMENPGEHQRHSLVSFFPEGGVAFCDFVA